MKVCVIQPQYCLDHSRSEEFFGWELECMMLHVLRQLKKTEGCLGDDAQCSLRADEDLVQVGACCMLGYGKCVDNVSVGENDLHAHALIIDLAVLGGKNTDSAVSQSAANGAAGKAAGDMHAGKALFVGVPFQLLEDHTGFGSDGMRIEINGDQLVHALHVQQNTSGHRQSAALAAGAATPGMDGDLIVVSDLQDLRDLFGGAGSYDDVRLRAFGTTVLPHTAEPEIVNGVGSAVHFRGGNIFNTDCILQLRTDHVKHK